MGNVPSSVAYYTDLSETCAADKPRMHKSQMPFSATTGQVWNLSERDGKTMISSGMWKLNADVHHASPETLQLRSWRKRKFTLTCVSKGQSEVFLLSYLSEKLEGSSNVSARLIRGQFHVTKGVNVAPQYTAEEGHRIMQGNEMYEIAFGRRGGTLQSHEKSVPETFFSIQIHLNVSILREQTDFYKERLTAEEFERWSRLVESDGIITVACEREEEQIEWLRKLNDVSH